LDEFLATLNPEQRAAVEHGDGPLLILAGAGSGKTRVLTHRFAHLIRVRNVEPRRIMAVTFTNKAANEMKERVGHLVSRLPWDAWIGTFHSLSARILRRHGASIGVDPNFTVFDDSDQLTLIRQCVKYLELDEKQYPPRALLSAIGRAKDQLWTPQDYSRAAEGAFQETAAAIYRQYQERLIQNNALDFDDIIFNTVMLFRQDKEALAHYQNHFEHLLIDEYQDINAAQFELVRRLAAKRRNICAVGDDDQSIYKFRGADIRNILDFERTYPDATVIKLEQNYRSTQTILEAAWSVVQNNRSRKEKKLWTAREGGDLIRLFVGEDDYHEAEYVANRIADAVNEGKRYGDCAVLYRINAQSRILEEVLLRRRVPYKIVGGLRFYDRKEVKDALGYLRALHNPSDSVSLTRIINVPARGIGEKTVEKLASYAEQHGTSLYNAIAHLEEIGIGGKIGSALRTFYGVIEGLRSKAAETKVSDLLPLVLERSGYRAELEKENTDEAKERLANLDELYTVAVEFETRSPDPSLGAFLEQASLMSSADTYEEGADAVTLMTLHAAKGLEFPVVLLVGLDEGLFPLSRSLDSDDEIEEERRLCYVGITRAKDSLYITRCYNRMKFGRVEPCMSSRFLTEIPPELFHETFALTTKDRWNERAAERKAVKASNLWNQTDSQAAYRVQTPPKSKPSLDSGSSPARREPSAPAASPVRTFSAPTVGAQRRQVAGVPAPGGEFKSGTKVRHEKFGEGIVVSVDAGGTLSVVFTDVGLKKLSLEYAKLDKVE
jgi:DNA helicase-2/ATP-dependent DNA helicase PcrA